MNNTKINNTKTSAVSNSLLSPGHRACAGCGQIIAARIVADTLGPQTIIANATGCLEVTTTPYPESSWGMPWIHSLFENAPAVASGIHAALNYKSKVESQKSKVKVIAQGGDGSTFDIGIGLLSGMWERNENILYICYDNEGYMNTGAQASSATQWATNTTTTPAGIGTEIDAIGSHLFKKDMIAIALAHNLKYVAQTTIGYPLDIIAKIKKAKEINGPSYIQILVPCIPGWKIESNQTIKLAKLATQTGLYPIIEYTDGVLTSSQKINQPQTPVEAYLKQQGRFNHLFKNETGRKQIKFIQQIANKNIRKYNL
ncbi:MAG: thiamine pyrophosphate-dependent enzyme [bacterium]|nr:thiamine pyrophosphate-dependent enzyme [bacterium]